MNSVKTFDARVSGLGGLDGQTAAEILRAAADITLVLDGEGVIRDLNISADPPLEEASEWLGRDWLETVTGESKRKVHDLLREARESPASRRRHVNHVLEGGGEVPVAYTTVRLGTSGSVVALGRDLRSVAALQQRLVQAQQAMERDYWRLRHVETRYRLLFQLSGEAVLLVDAGTHKVVDVNPAAARALDATARQLVGRPFAVGGEVAERKAVQAHLDEVRARGEAEGITVRLGDASFVLRAAMVRQDGAGLFLVRLVPVGESLEAAAPSRVVAALQALPDAFALTDAAGRVLGTNRAFLDLAELATEEQARGERLDRWIGRPGADLEMLLSILREHGAARLFPTSLRGEYGSVAEVEISAAAATGEEACIGLTIRDVGRRLASGPTGARDLSRAVEDLTQLLGKVTLRDLIRDTTDLVERHFIEAALELTGDNRTSAAEVLGVSRQSLYVKLRRYGYDLKEERE